MYKENEILAPILKSPKAYAYLSELQKALSEEKKKRKKFYQEMTEQEKVEFIEGEVVVHSPVVLKHNRATKLLLKILDTFVASKQLGYVGVEKILIQLTRNDFEPDICFFGNEKAKKFTDEQMFFPAPDFIAEITSKSTEKRDRGVKFQDYALHGVAEYWIIDPDRQTVEQYTLNGEEYELLKKTDNGIIKSTQITGFEIPVKAIFSETENLEALKNM